MSSQPAETWSVETLSAVLSAFTALAALFIGGLSIREVRRIDDRARKREANERDDVLQSRLEALYPRMYRSFGSPPDAIPLEARPTVLAFYSLYADAYTAHRDDLLPRSDAKAFLDEFAYWARSKNAKGAWAALRGQSWPDGFVQHVDTALAGGGPYQQLGVKSPPGRWLEAGAVVHYLTGFEPPELASAKHVLSSLADSAGSIPPDYLRADNPQDTNDAYLAWLRDEDAQIWHRVTAVIAGRVVGHVLVSEAHEYAREHLAAFGKARHVLEISRLFVDPALQGDGVGSDLLQAAVSFIESVGAQPMLVMVEDQKLQGWYEDLGWHVVASFDGVQGKNLVLGRKQSA